MGIIIEKVHDLDKIQVVQQLNVPDEQWTKKEILAFLLNKGIEADMKMTKTELINLLK